MTPEERVDALKGLLGRLRTNAGGRLSPRTGDEEEFVPRSVIEARREAAAAAARASSASSAATNGKHAPSDGDPSPPNGANGTSHANPDDRRSDGEAWGPGERPAERGGMPRTTSERFRFVPDDARFDTEPPPTAIPGGGGGSLEEALLQVEVAAMEAEREAPAPVAEKPAAIALPSAPPLELDLYDESFDAPTSTGESDEIEALALDAENAADARVRPEPPPAPPASSTRAVLPPTPLAHGEQDAGDPAGDEDEPAEEASEDALGWTHDRPTRVRDPLARTAQNPVPAEEFERAIAEGREIDDDAELLGGDADDGADDDGGRASAPVESAAASAPRSAEAEAPVTAPGGGRDEAPISSRQPVDLDRAVDAGLDSEPPPQSGEVASQRQPAAAVARRGHDLDETTPSAEEGAQVAREADRLLAEALPSSPPPTRPGVVGKRPLAAASFLQILDAALELGEAPESRG